MNNGNIISIVGSVFLFFTAIIHLFKGYPRLLNVIDTKFVDLPNFSRKKSHIMSQEEIKIMWLSFGLHLIVISILCIFLLFKSNLSLNFTVLILGFIPMLDAILLKTFPKELHLGACLLALSGSLIVFGQLLNFF